MLVLVDLLELEAVVAPELGVASSHGVGGFQQIVAQVTVAGFDQASILGLEFIGLVLRLDESRIFGNGYLSGKTADIADFSDDTGRVNFSNTGEGYKRVGDDFKLLLNGFLQRPDLAFQRPHGRDGGGHDLVDRIVHGFGQTVGTPSRVRF